MIKSQIALGVLLALAGLTGTLSASTVFESDFEGIVGAEWSKQTTSLTPVGSRRFLGMFQQETVNLTLDNVPDNQTVTVSFDLYIINTWDGSQLVDPLSNPPHTVGPDIWELNVAGGPTLLHTTFSIFDGTKAIHSFRSFPQSFPGSYPTDSFLARTGAVENDTLGYFEGDSVYHLEFDFDHSTGPVVLNFSSEHPVTDPEVWGIDNIVVTAVPESNALTLLFVGIVILATPIARRRIFASHRQYPKANRALSATAKHGQ